MITCALYNIVIVALIWLQNLPLTSPTGLKDRDEQWKDAEWRQRGCGEIAKNITGHRQVVVTAEFAYTLGQVLHGNRNNGIEDGALTQLTSSASTIGLPQSLPTITGPAKRSSHASAMPSVFSLCRNIPQARVLAFFSYGLLPVGRGNILTINCSCFDQHGVDPVAFQGLTEGFPSSHQQQHPHPCQHLLHPVCHLGSGKTWPSTAMV